MKRLTTNLLASLVTIIGGTSALGAGTAQAAVRGGCEDLHAAEQEFVNNCAAMGGTSYSCNSACSSIEYTMDCHCYT